jgi:hypothetical protein
LSLTPLEADDFTVLMVGGAAGAIVAKPAAAIAVDQGVFAGDAAALTRRAEGFVLSPSG